MPSITQALAEIKTIGKRISKKHELITGHLARQDSIRDPFEKDGTTEAEVIERETQAIKDLETRLIALRVAILAANNKTTISIEGETHTITQWLIWKREVAPLIKRRFDELTMKIAQLRKEIQQKGLAVITTGDRATRPQDVLININEHELALEREKLEKIMGDLDGELSQKNATVEIAL